MRLHHAYLGVFLMLIGLSVGVFGGLMIFIGGGFTTVGLLVFLDDLKDHTRNWRRGRRGL